MVNLRSDGDEAVLVGEVAGELGKSVTLAVTVKRWAEDGPETGKADRGGLAHPKLHRDLHLATRDQAI